MSLRAALAMATVVAGAAVALRVVDPRGGLPGLTMEALPLLFIGALLCSAGLLRRAFLPGAWVATVVATGMAAVQVVGSVRAWEPDSLPESWPWLVALAELALLAGAAIAAAYAVGRRAGTAVPLARAWEMVVVAALAAIALVGGWAVVSAVPGSVAASLGAADGSELSPLRLSGRLAAGFLAVATMVGAWRDLAIPVRRARANAKSAADLPRALADQLLPTASGFRRRGREEERARLAADLHALVLPDLRRASSAAAASGAAGEPLAADLRHALAGVERLMHERESVVFEEFGLIAALEWLAERTQEKSPLDVVIELDGVVDDPEALPKRVSRAAFRVAMLAVDNVLRHADASRVELRLAVEGGALRLSVVDDGKGIQRGAASRGGRGLVDMRSAAAEVEASIVVPAQDHGTTIEFRWSPAKHVAAEPAIPVADPADRRNALHP